MSIGSSSSSMPEPVEVPLVESLSNDIDILGHNASFDERRRDFSTKTRVCYNRACPDYRRERPDWEECGCKKTAVKGAGDASFG